MKLSYIILSIYVISSKYLRFCFGASFEYTRDFLIAIRNRGLPDDFYKGNIIEQRVCLTSLVS